MMVVNAALFQDMVPAGAGGSKSGTGSADPQGSGFARILNGRVDREGAASQADAKGRTAQRNDTLKRDQAAASTQDAEPVLVSAKELTARAEAQQEKAGEAAEAVPAPAAEGSAAQSSNQVPGGKALPANGTTPGAAQQQANQETAADQLKLPAFQVNANPAAAASLAQATPATILPQQVLAQDAAAPRENGTQAAGESRSHAPHHGRKKGGEDAVSGGSDKTASGSQSEQDAPVSLVAMLTAGATMVTAASADATSAVIPAANDETAGIPATAATVISQQQPASAGVEEAATAVKAETVPQNPAQGVQSAQLQALQQKALKFAAAQDEAAAKLLQQGAGEKWQAAAAQQSEPVAQQAAPRQVAAQSASGTTAAGLQNGLQAEQQGGQGFIATRVAGISFKAAEAVSAKAGEETAGTAAAKTAGTPEETPVKPVTAPKQEVTELRQQDAQQQKGAQEAQAPKQSQNPAAVKDAVITPAPAETATAQAEQGAPDQGGRPDSSTVAADRKGAGSAEAGHAAANGTKMVAEPAAVNQKSASTEISGTKTASAAVFQRAAAQGNPGQNASGDAGEQGHSEQKAQNQAQQAQPATAGMVQFTAARESAQPAPAPSSAQSALHESILSQVKEAWSPTWP
jgi:hypothetical protein